MLDIARTGLAAALAVAASAAGAQTPPQSFQHPPIVSRSIDVCGHTGADGKPIPFVGCPFDPAKLGFRYGDLAIAKALPRVAALVLEEFDARSGLCKDPADTVYVARSDFRDGALMIVRRGILLGTEQRIDRALLAAYLDPAREWPDWPPGRAKGFLTCAEMAAHR